jgi:hypothetical protein
MGTLSSPVAYVTISNDVGNQDGTVTLAGTTVLKSQNGYPSIVPGEIMTYEVQSTQDGMPRSVVVIYYAGKLQIPIKNAAGETPVLKNGYDYTIRISGSGEAVEGYTVTFEESAAPRDLSGEIESL